jgi:hypothetical protein
VAFGIDRNWSPLPRYITLATCGEVCSPAILPKTLSGREDLPLPGTLIYRLPTELYYQ